MNLISVKTKIVALYNIFFKKRFNSSIEYWEHRARQYGKRAVLNIGHSYDQISMVTQTQKETIFPLLKKKLNGKEKTILDYGCGTGRFTYDLANIIGGAAVGVDPIQSLLDLAPKNENVEYKRIVNGVIPINAESFDVVWVCLVLGGIISNKDLVDTTREINRVLKNGGLLVLVENTTNIKDGEYWKFRSIDQYQQLFDFVDLSHEADYYDLDEKISILMGRKDV